jgi:alkanesulfonate monooxygenase SsuD/methylene tetrahydromethanopterin reductase-like flavin-dependent oxidoreductase (luciferase family)
MSFATTVERWRMFEDLGFDSVWDCDHFNQPSNPAGPYFEAWTLLSALAAHTSRIRIGVLVTSNTFRHPALLAQQAVTVDHVSNGRLDLGLGAGWFAAEHERFGVEFPPPAGLVGRFREAVEIVDSLLRNEETTYQGRHYQLDGAYLRPRPVQKPRPPLTLGAHRSRMLRICAEYADGWNSFGSIEEIAERNQILDQHCIDIGRDPAEVRRSFYGWASNMVEQGLPDPWDSSDAFEDVIGRYREVGINEFIMDQPRPEQQGVLERVAAETIPRLRGQS